MFRRHMPDVNAGTERLLTGDARITRDARVDAARPSFEVLYREHFGFVWRCLRRFGIPDSQAEDAAQDTFVVLHRKLADLRADASPKAFLFGIAFRVARDYRRSARRKTTPLDAEAQLSGERGPFERTAEVQAAEVLDRFLDTLDDDKRAVFVLAELEGLTVPEITELVDANLNTVYSRLRAARARFEEFFREWTQASATSNRGSGHG